MADRIELPPPDEIGGMLLALALGRRRSRREFAGRGLDWTQVGQLLWAAQGVTDEVGRLRTVPSAGALYPLELDAAVASGLYRYRPADHTLVQRAARDVRLDLARAAVGQSWLAGAPCVFSICAVPSRTTGQYGNRGARYVQMEAGHAAQNLLLAAVSLELDAVPVGAFDDEELARVLLLAPGEIPLYLVPVGWPRRPR
ncbi:MAG TPA: SagB/ThcOx family dehydrogenase [Burkholderiales bacterium]|jgi:SagB-type dehydrogenase family enzyme